MTKHRLGKRKEKLRYIISLIDLERDMRNWYQICDQALKTKWTKWHFEEEEGGNYQGYSVI